MKTIKQAAKEFAESEIMETYDSLIEELKRISFIYGAKFAQQWISVDDELPAAGETVLLKFENNEEHVTTGIYIKSFHGDCAYQESGEQCTHWRPIERK